jgi:predicted aspartyl protease
VACAEQNPEMSETNYESLQSSFKSGDADLTCNAGCAFNYGSIRHELLDEYNNRDWNDLANHILEIGYNNSQSWFYLASAAEGLGYMDAARIYYNEVLQVPRCDMLINVCDGIDVTTIAKNKAISMANSNSSANIVSEPATQSPTQDAVGSPTQNQSTSFSSVSSVSSEPQGNDIKPYEIRMVKDAGIFEVPVIINGVIPLNFTIDSGAADVNIPADVALTLIRTGTLQTSDFIGTQTYTLADGSTVPSPIFNIRSLKVGNRTIFNITASISNVNGPLLLGQSFLSRFNSWSIDNSRQVLILK